MSRRCRRGRRQLSGRTDRRRRPAAIAIRCGVMGEEILVDSPLAGRHQLRNIALAIAAAEELGVSDSKSRARQIEQGIRETHWPGRFQVLPPSEATHRREMVLDVAHNPAGTWALRSALSENFPGRPITLCFAAMGDKAVQEMADILFPIAEQVVVTQVNNPRAATTDELLQAGARTGNTAACGRDRVRGAGACTGGDAARRNDRGDRLDLPGRRSDGNQWSWLVASG